jgi:2,4-dienoyl-CoA reductase-like NADH-dependent reductase (Old Yellow Enzyme family)
MLQWHAMSENNPSPHLFQPLTIKSITLRNRIGVSPMCEYSSEDGVANDWHLVHLGSRAVGGAGLVIAEATAVSPEGRITPGDAGIWADKQIEPVARINRFIKKHGAVPGMQIAHAGRKASAARPWEGGAHLPDDKGGWPMIAPSPLAFGDDLNKVPREMTEADIRKVQNDFVAATKRALTAGVEFLEIHAAHGYLPINARINTAAVLKIASAFFWKPRKLFAPRGRITFPWPCGFQRLIGCPAAGKSKTVSRWQNN